MKLKDLFKLCCDMAGMQIFSDDASLQTSSHNFSFVIKNEYILCCDTNRRFQWNKKKDNKKNYARFSRFLFNQLENKMDDLYRLRLANAQELFHKNTDRNFTDNLGIMYRVLRENKIPDGVLAAAFRRSFGKDLFVTFVKDSEYRERVIRG